MARTRRTISIEEKIAKAQEAVDNAKAKYDAAVDDLKKLQAKKQDMQKEELMQAVLGSDKSYDEIMAFLGDKEK